MCNSEVHKLHHFRTLLKTLSLKRSKKEHSPPICSSVSRKVENIVQDLVFESFEKEHLPPICSSLSRSVFLLHLLTLSLASWITCQRCKGRVSPCDRKEQNSPSVTVPWVKNKNHTETFLFTIDTCHFLRREQTYFFQVKNSTVYGYSPKILYCSMEIDITCCLNNQHFIKITQVNCHSPLSPCTHIILLFQRGKGAYNFVRLPVRYKSRRFISCLRSLVKSLMNWSFRVLHGT